MTRKTCTKCGRLKPTTDFFRGGRSGPRSECKTCTSKSKSLQAGAYRYAEGVLRERHRDEFDQVYVEAKQRAGIA